MGFNRYLVYSESGYLTYCLESPATCSTKLLSFVGNSSDSALFLFVRYRSHELITLCRFGRQEVIRDIRFVAATSEFVQCFAGWSLRVAGAERWPADIGPDLLPYPLIAWTR